MKFQVVVTRIQRIPVEVDVDDYKNLTDAAIEAAEEVPPGGKFHVCYDTAKQIGEPWARSYGWYDLHGPGDVIVVERAIGNPFSQDDVDLLKNRLTAIGFPVRDSWNGAGASTVSFKVSGRKTTKPMSKKHLAILLAPR